jgi:hypothetical protein
VLSNSGQPYIGRTPAGNIRLSAAILFVGALPAQALRMFGVLNCPTIGKKAFFRHQSHPLQPAIASIWTSWPSSKINKRLYSLLGMGGQIALDIVLSMALTQ